MMVMMLMLMSNDVSGAILDILDPSADSIECSGNATAAKTCTFIGGDPAVLEVLRAHCATDTTCSARFGQTLGPNLPVFAFLLTATSPTNVSTLCLETFIYDVVCNKSVTTLGLDLWVQQLLIQTNSANPCASNERFVLNPSGTGGNCQCLSDKTCTSSNRTTNGILIIIFVIVVVFAVAAFGLSMWKMAGTTRMFDSLSGGSSQLAATRGRTSQSTGAMLRSPWHGGRFGSGTTIRGSGQTPSSPATLTVPHRRQGVTPLARPSALGKTISRPSPLPATTASAVVTAANLHAGGINDGLRGVGGMQSQHH